MANNLRLFPLFCFLLPQMLWLAPQLAGAEVLSLIESYGKDSSSFSMTLYWPGARAQNLEARVLFRPLATPEKQYVIAPRGQWFNYYSTNEDQHVYNLRLQTFPAMPFGGKGDLIVEVFARGKKIAPLVLRFWVSGDRGVTLVSPSTLRAILNPEK